MVSSSEYGVVHLILLIFAFSLFLYVCKYVRMYAWMYVWSYKHTHIHTHTYIYIYIHISVCVCTYMWHADDTSGQGISSVGYLRRSPPKTLAESPIP